MAKKKRRTVKLIDAHGHANWYGYDADRLVANMDEMGIDVMWLLTWEVPEGEYRPGDFLCFWPGDKQMGLNHVVEAARKYPNRFVPFYAPDPRQPSALDRVKRAVDYYGVRGFGEMKVRVTLDDPHVLPIFHFCGERGMPVTFHLDPPPSSRGDLEKDPAHWYCGGWDHLGRALERCPKTVFLGHAPGFWRGISGDGDQATEGYPKGPVTPGGHIWEYLDRYPNLWCDLSAGSGLNAISRDPKIGKEFLLRYQDRCLFARDYFDDRLHKFLLGLGLPRAAQRKIFCENALRLVPLA